MEANRQFIQGVTQIGGTTTTSTTIPVREEIPIIEQVTQQPVITQKEIITDVPIVQQQRVIEKQDIIENQPVKVGETQTIRVTTTTVPTPVSLLQGVVQPPILGSHLETTGFQTTGLQTTGLQSTGFSEGIGERLRQEKDEFIGEHRQMKPPEEGGFLSGTGIQQQPLMQQPLGTGFHQPIIQEPLVQQPLVSNLPGQQMPLGSGISGSTVAGEYFITKDPLLTQPQQTFVQQPMGLGSGLQQQVGQPHLVTETIVHPVYDERGRMTLPPDLREENLLNHPELAPQKQGFGTKIKNMLHLGRHKQGVTTGGMPMEGGVVREGSLSSSPSPDKYKEKHVISQGKTLTGKDKFVEKEKIVR